MAPDEPGTATLPRGPPGTPAGLAGFRPAARSPARVPVTLRAQEAERVRGEVPLAAAAVPELAEADFLSAFWRLHGLGVQRACGRLRRLALRDPDPRVQAVVDPQPGAVLGQSPVPAVLEARYRPKIDTGSHDSLTQHSLSRRRGPSGARARRLLITAIPDTAGQCQFPC